MDPAVAGELETLLGYMKACRRSVDAVETGQMPGPTLPSPAGYESRLAWSQATGALRILEHLDLISHDERLTWEAEARALVDPRHP